MKNSFKILIIILFAGIIYSFSKDATYKIAVMKYNGGGDWYANPTSLSNLIKFCNSKISTNIHKTPDQVHVGSEEIFNYPFLHMTGHGNVIFSADDVSNSPARPHIASAGAGVPTSFGSAGGGGG